MKIKDLLTNVLTQAEMKKLITSFDIIGDIAIIEIPRGLEKKEKLIAKALMTVHKNIKVVAKKSQIEGTYRIRKLRVIAGERRTETIHKEHNCIIKLDTSKVYFSVRLSHERERIAAQVKNGENVLVMFAGVGPFALVIARKKPNAKIIGIELNPVAAEYFKENIKLNKLKNCEALYGDVRKLIAKRKTQDSRLICWADRILMTLPKNAEDFLDVAFLAAKNNTIVHFYHFGPEEKVFDDAETKITNAAKKSNLKIKILNKKIVRPYAPKIVQVCIDFKMQ